MAREQLKTLTEPMYYLLLALIQPQHGYGIMQSISEMTQNQVQVGAGTLYALLARFEGEGIIAQILERDRKKIYQITPKGAEVLTEEYLRLNRMVEDGKKYFDSTGTMIPIHYESAEQEVTQEQESPAEENQAHKEAEGTPAERETPAEPEAEGQGAGKDERDEKKRGAEPREKEERRGFRGFRKGIFAT